MLLGTSIRMSQEEILRAAQAALIASPEGAGRFETWHVRIGSERVAPKWLVGILFDKPVGQFRTVDARRVLSLLGMDCLYAGRRRS